MFPTAIMPKAIKNYIEVLKPRETGLLTFIGLCAGIVAASGYPPACPFLRILGAVLFGSAGTNGLTNYLDRQFDARMERTRDRALPSLRINRPEKVLPLTIALVVIGLALAWFLHPFCLLAGALGIAAALIARKRSTCVFPQGAIASCAPVAIGWLAIDPEPNWTILFLCLLVGTWLPLHVWSVMVANREDYLRAGLRIFPVTWEVKDAVKVLLAFSIVLYGVSLALYFVAGFGLIYLVVANILGLLMIYASCRLLASGASRDAWRVYKLSAYPYLGLLFLAMCLAFWL